MIRRSIFAAFVLTVALLTMSQSAALAAAPTPRAASSSHTVTPAVGRVAAAESAAISENPGSLVPIVAERLLDTRSGTGAQQGVVPSGGSITVPVAGMSGLPTSNIGAVELKLVAVSPTGTGYLEAYDSTQPKPLIASLDFTASRTTSVTVLVRLVMGNSITIYTSAPTQIVADVTGYVVGGAAGEPAAGTVVPAVPVRLLDTRGATSGETPAGRLTGGRPVTLTVAAHADGQGTIPAAGSIAAVDLELAVVGPSASGYLAAYAGSTRPTVSQVNFPAGGLVSNSAWVPVAPDGTITLYASASTDVVVDLAAWVAGPPGTVPAETGEVGLVTPVRLLDSRPSALRPGAGRTVTVRGAHGVPATHVAAALVTVTDVAPTATGFLTVEPHGLSYPDPRTSLNASRGAVEADTILVPLGPSGSIDITTTATTNVLVDLAGYVYDDTPPRAVSSVALRQDSMSDNSLNFNFPGDDDAAVVLTAKQAGGSAPATPTSGLPLDYPSGTVETASGTIGEGEPDELVHPGSTYTYGIWIEDFAGNLSPEVTVTGTTLGAAELVASADHVCTAATDNTVNCWGAGADGELGVGNSEFYQFPISVLELTGQNAAAAGTSFSCSADTGGSTVVFCWGADDKGQLGDGAIGTGHDQTRPVGLHLPAAPTSISAGGAHTCVSYADGTVACWGQNVEGDLGSAVTGSVAKPTVVPGVSGATSVAAGGYHSCAIVADGAVDCWGFGVSGQLGDGRTTSSSSVVRVSGLTGVSSLSGGNDHTCAVTGGLVKCWGLGTSGQLGNGGAASSDTPVTVRGISNAVSVSAGAASTCAVLQTGALDCWGLGTSGQLGNGAVASHSAPVAVTGITTAARVAVGSSYACVQVASGGVYCWGTGYDGELGADAAIVTSRTPIEVGRRLS